MGVLSAPLRAFLFIVQEVVDQADRVAYGEEELRAALASLYLDWEEGRIGEKDFQCREADLIGRLAEAQRRQKEARP